MDEIIQMFHGWFVWLSRLHPNPEKIFIWRMFSKLVKLFKLFSAKDWNTENLKSLSLAILNLDHWRSWPFSTSWIRICIFLMPGGPRKDRLWGTFWLFRKTLCIYFGLLGQLFRSRPNNQHYSNRHTDCAHALTATKSIPSATISIPCAPRFK